MQVSRCALQVSSGHPKHTRPLHGGFVMTLLLLPPLLLLLLLLQALVCCLATLVV
jgi:hypothetical protein